MKTFPFLLAVLSLVASPAAQTLSDTSPLPYSGNVTYAGTYDVATQTLIPAPPPPLDTVVFDNTTTNGSYFAPGSNLVNMDWGTLSAGGANDITAIQIGYATTTQAPGTVSLNVYLHQGATGFSVLGAPVTGYTITGLPGSTLGPGLAQAFAVDVTLPATLTLPDGPIGWSYQMSNTASGPLTVGPPVEAGVIDAFDQYTSAFAYQGTFFFGGSPFASFYMQLTATTECFLVIGDGVGSGAGFQPYTHAFDTQVGQVQDFYPVLMESIPEFVLPDVGSRTFAGTGMLAGPGGGQATTLTDWIADGEFSVQVVMWNPQVFPGQPEQSTQGLYVRVLPDGSVVTRPFGSGTGMQVWAETGVNAQGQAVVRFPFSIPGL